MKDKMNTTTFRKWLESKLDPEWSPDEWPARMDIVDDVKQFDYREALKEFNRRFTAIHVVVSHEDVPVMYTKWYEKHDLEGEGVESPE